LEFSSRLCVAAIRSHTEDIFTFLSLEIFNGIRKNNATVNCIAVQHKKVFITVALTDRNTVVQLYKRFPADTERLFFVLIVNTIILLSILDSASL
jgi:hypothetical protein